MEHLYRPNGRRAASPYRQQVKRGLVTGNFQRRMSDSSMHDPVGITATEEGGCLLDYIYMGDLGVG
jgi:hypothetical protein